MFRVWISGFGTLISLCGWVIVSIFVLSSKEGLRFYETFTASSNSYALAHYGEGDESIFGVEVPALMSDLSLV